MITRCSFETLRDDIQFCVLFEPAEGKEAGTYGELADEESEETIIVRQKCDSHLGPVTGTIPLTRPGRLTLVWDNG